MVPGKNRRMRRNRRNLIYSKKSTTFKSSIHNPEDNRKKAYKLFSQVKITSTCVYCKICTRTDRILNEQKSYQFCYNLAADLSSLLTAGTWYNPDHVPASKTTKRNSCVHWSDFCSADLMYDVL
jgi:hypothetical protein